MTHFSPEQERINQIQEARSMSEGERPTLHLSRQRPPRQEHRPEQRNARPQRAKHTPKGHDAKLKAWQAECTPVAVGLIFGVTETVDALQGVIIGSDRYTITLSTDAGQEALIYKHAISAIYPQTRTSESVQ